MKRFIRGLVILLGVWIGAGVLLALLVPSTAKWAGGPTFVAGVVAAWWDAGGRIRTTFAGRTKTCPDCAERVGASARICRYCRHDFTSDPPRPTDPQPRRGAGRVALAATVAVVVIIAIVAVASLILGGEPKPDPSPQSLFGTSRPEVRLRTPALPTPELVQCGDKPCLVDSRGVVVNYAWWSCEDSHRPAVADGWCGQVRALVSPTTP